MYKQVKINMKQEHHELLKLKANESNLSLAQYVRDKLDIDLNDNRIIKKSRKKIPKASYTTADPKLLYHLSSIGNNLNQIAKKVNISKSIDTNIILNYLIEIQRQINDYRN